MTTKPRRPSRKLVRRRRQTWTEKRKARGLEKPLPLGAIEVNTMSVSTRPAHAKQILLNAAAAILVDPNTGIEYPVDYILGCEGDDYDAAKVLGREWDVHHDQTHPDKDGAFQAIRRTRGHLSDAHVIHASDPLPGVLPARWLSAALVHVDDHTPHKWWFTGVAGHAPPMRAISRWGQYMRSLRRAAGDVTGADFNKTVVAVAAAFGRRVGGRGVLSLTTRWRIPVSPVIPVDVDGDHTAVARILFPLPKEK